MTLSEKIWGNAIGAFVQYGYTAAKAALKPLLVTDNGDGTGTLHVATDSSALPTGAATSAKQDTGNASLASIKTAVEGSTPAGTNVIGKVGIDPAVNEVVAGYKLKRINATFTGIGATSQYDAVGTLTEIPNWATAYGRGATIREIRISVNNNAIAPQFELHFFNASDATVAADNVTWTELAADYTKRAGYVIMPACAKATGSGTIDMVRAQSDDYGQSLAKEVVCAAGSTSVWLALKLLTTGISFAGSPGNTIAVSMVIEQS